jgi:microcystin-dependent protein
MVLHWKHLFTSAKADGTDSTLVKPSNWNADHAATTDTGTGMVVGRDTTGPGALQELPLVYDPVKSVWTASGSGGFQVPGAGATARPPSPTQGTIRWNSDTAVLEVYAGTWQAIAMGPQMPVGTILAFGSPNAPAGYLACAGNRYNRTDYPALYAAIGLTWVPGGTDDGTTFLVPNLQGRVLVGSDPALGGSPGGAFGGAIAVGQTAGAWAQSTPLPAHTHGFSAYNGAQPVSFTPTGAVSGQGGGGGQMYVIGATDSSGISPANTDVRQASAGVFYMIKF